MKTIVLACLQEHTFDLFESEALASFLLAKVKLRPCSFVSDWWVGTIPSRIAYLIYINFD
jgi:hypothetical protein